MFAVAKTKLTDHVLTSKVNNVKKPDVFALPHMKACVDQVRSTIYVSKFDLLKDLLLAENPLSLCTHAFITPQGLYKCTITPFFLRNVPAAFQHLKNTVTAGLDGCSVHLDDLVI